MKDQNKTQRFFDLILWLQKSSTSGLSRERVMEEYGISEKTFLRDIEELGELVPLGFHYDREEKRLYGSPAFLGGRLLASDEKSAPTPETRPGSSLIEDKINLFSGKKSEGYFFHVTPTRLRLSEKELETLFEAVLKGSPVEFSYRGKVRRGEPLFFCYYAERWYFFSRILDGGLILKFRLDQMEKVVLPLVSSSSAAVDLPEIRREATQKIRDSHNIFVDLNTRDNFWVDFRFFFSEEFLRDEIGRFESASRPDPAEPNVTDLRIAFSGYSEARTFMNKWLGRFQILAPDEIRKRYLEELEEAVDVI